MRETMSSTYQQNNRPESLSRLSAEKKAGQTRLERSLDRLWAQRSACGEERIEDRRRLLKGGDRLRLHRSVRQEPNNTAAVTTPFFPKNEGCRVTHSRESRWRGHLSYIGHVLTVMNVAKKESVYNTNPIYESIKESRREA